jgi:ubiquinone/menaquinone biosynthesis C-methylase UbiE
LTEVNPRVNYDDIAATYDARYTSGVGEGQHTVPVALRQLLRLGITNRILEVGCGTSQLILLSNEAYATGFAKLKQHLDEAEAQGRTLQFREDISLVMVTGRKP